MKNSIILEIFKGRRGNCETIKLSDEQKKISEKVTELYDELLKTFNEDQKILLEEFTDALAEETCAMSDLFYAEGFKIGVRLAVECMQNEN